MKNYKLKVLNANFPNYSFDVLLNGVIVLKGACFTEQEMLDCFEAIKLNGVQPMKTFTFPKRVVFNQLLLNCADGSGYGVDLDNATDAQKIAFLADTINSELGWMLEKQTTFTMAKHWLQGLASACTIPFYNGQIVEWLESNGFIVTPHNEYKAIDQYWDNAAFALVAMINQQINKTEKV